MAFSSTRALRRELESALPHRPFAIRFWDGAVVRATESGAPTFTIHTPRALAHALRAPGELGLGRAYAQGMIDVDDIDAALLIVDTFEAPRLSVGQMARLGAAVVRACGVTRPPRVPETELRLRGERHTIMRDRRAVRHHYNVGNEFFALFLDRSMTYSCAYWQGGAETLEEAQEAKLELVCKKLALKEGERVLDVGCGWGSFAIHAASRHRVRVLGVTLSEPQAELGRARAIEGRASATSWSFAWPTTVRSPRSRSTRSRASAWSSTSALERIDLYARQLDALLRPGGRLLNHGIAKLMDFDTKDEGAFSERFVFPDGVPLPLSRVQLALERTGLVTRHVEGLPADYHRTLGHWIERYEGHWEEAVRIAGIERARIWRLYLHAARQGFQTGWASIYQVLAHKPSP